MKKLIFITCLFFVFRCDVFGQEMAKFKGQILEVKTTSEDLANSRYFVELPTGERAYLSKLDGWEKPVLVGNDSATYKHEMYFAFTGSRGGRYIVSKSGSKIYIPKVVAAK
jgi:hypothetical protein